MEAPSFLNRDLRPAVTLRIYDARDSDIETGRLLSVSIHLLRVHMTVRLRHSGRTPADHSHLANEPVAAGIGHACKLEGSCRRLPIPASRAKLSIVNCPALRADASPRLRAGTAEGDGSESLLAREFGRGRPFAERNLHRRQGRCRWGGGADHRSEQPRLSSLRARRLLPQGQKTFKAVVPRLQATGAGRDALRGLRDAG